MAIVVHNKDVLHNVSARKKYTGMVNKILITNKMHCNVYDAF